MRSPLETLSHLTDAHQHPVKSSQMYLAAVAVMVKHLSQSFRKMLSIFSGNVIAIVRHTDGTLPSCTMNAVTIAAQ